MGLAGVVNILFEYIKLKFYDTVYMLFLFVALSIFYYGLAVVGLHQSVLLSYKIKIVRN